MRLGMETDGGGKNTTLNAFAVVQVSFYDGVDKSIEVKNGDNWTNLNILKVGSTFGQLYMVGRIKDFVQVSISFLWYTTEFRLHVLPVSILSILQQMLHQTNL